MGRQSSQGQDYTPFDDGYRGFDAREEETARGSLILTLAIGVLMIFGAVVWNTYRQGVRPEGEGLPSVLAENTPIKTAPAEAGRAVVENTDIRFFDEMDASDREPAVELASAGVELAGASAVSDGLPTNLRRGPVEPITDLTDAPPPAVVTEPAPTAEKVATPSGKCPHMITECVHTLRARLATTFAARVAAKAGTAENGFTRAARAGLSRKSLRTWRPILPRTLRPSRVKSSSTGFLPL